MSQFSVGRGTEVPLVVFGEVAAPPAPEAPPEACARCGHPMSRHDAVAARYCTATGSAGSRGRTCICRPES